MNIFEGRESKLAGFKERQEFVDFLPTADEKTMPSHCVLCGKKVNSLCHSHSVPKMVLKEIAKDGKVLLANSVFGISGFDVYKHTKKAGIFHVICPECDSKVFQDYENSNNLIHTPTDKMMTEIALKNSLHQLRKRQMEIYIIDHADPPFDPLFRQQQIIQKKQQIKELNEDIDFYKTTLNNNKHNRFTIVCYKKLPYKAPIAVETEFDLPTDMKNNPINIFSPKKMQTRVQFIHLCVFPLHNETIVLMFYHNRDKKYASFNNQFNEFPEDKALMYLNWIIFKYTENYFFSVQVNNAITNNKNLQMLSQEYNGRPCFGIGVPEAFEGFRYIQPYEIPNFLDIKHRL